MFNSIQQTSSTLAEHSYIADAGISTSLFLALRMEKPLFLEGEPGVGKTEVAKVLAQALSTQLIRLQCYEGLDLAQAVYEWNYPRQLLEIQARQSGEAKVETEDLFSEHFLIHRPLLQAIDSSHERAPVLLIDELDRADEEFESFLLELLSEFQVTIPELGTLRAKHRPVVIVTSNRTREIHDALKTPLCLPLDRLSEQGNRVSDSASQAAGYRYASAESSRHLRPGIARRRALQAARGGRDSRLGARARSSGKRNSIVVKRRRHPRISAQVPRRCRQDARGEGASPDRSILDPAAPVGCQDEPRDEVRLILHSRNSECESRLGS